MTEREFQYSLEMLTALSDCALRLKGMLKNHFKVDETTLIPDADVVPAPANPAVIVEDENTVKDSGEYRTVEQVIEDYGLLSEDMTDKDLQDYLTEYGIAFKAKATKAQLAHLIAENIINGTIVVEEVETVNDDTEEIESPEGRIERETEIEATIREKITSGKLKISAVKKFLKTYYDGDPEMADLDDMEEDDLIDYYVSIQVCLVDDDAEVHGLEEPYYRDGLVFCCGRECVEMDASEDIYCEICGAQYEKE